MKKRAGMWEKTGTEEDGGFENETEVLEYGV